MNPVGAFRFSVFLVDRPPGGIASPLEGLGALATAANAVTAVRFAEVSGIDAGMEVETYHEGGRNTNPLRFTRWGQFSSLVFRRGVTADNGLWEWYFQVQFQTGAPLRKNGFVLLQAGTAATALPGIGGQPIAAWFFSNGLPERLTGPGLDAARNEIAIETLEIAHEGLLRLGQGMIPGLAAFVERLEA
jgi:phage tail-like protein